MPFDKRGYKTLTEEEEIELEDRLYRLWMLEDENGEPKFTGKQIAKALGFDGVKTLPDGSPNPYADIPLDRIYHYRHKFDLPKRHDHTRYPHRYKYGKQDDMIDLKDVFEKIENIESGSFHGKRKRSGCSLGFWGGFRNTENLRLKRKDFEYDEDMHGKEMLRINAFRLKKGDIVSKDQATYPIELPLDWLLVDYIADWVERYDPEERPWNVTRKTYWAWIKDVFGEKKYPHWLRNNRISYFCSDPRFSLAEVRKWTGLHLVTIDNYITKSRRLTLTATEKMSQKMKEKNIKK